MLIRLDVHIAVIAADILAREWTLYYALTCEPLATRVALVQLPAHF